MLSNENMLSQTGDASNSVMEENKLSKRITELEIELAQTKLALVESECRNQVCTSFSPLFQQKLHTIKKPC